MFRTVIYFCMPYQSKHEATRMTSETVKTYEEAEQILNYFAETVHQTAGGHIEQHIEGMGWLLCPEFAGK